MVRDFHKFLIDDKAFPQEVIQEGKAADFLFKKKKEKEGAGIPNPKGVKDEDDFLP